MQAAVTPSVRERELPRGDTTRWERTWGVNEAWSEKMSKKIVNFDIDLGIMYIYLYIWERERERVERERDRDIDESEHEGWTKPNWDNWVKKSLILSQI